MRGSRASLARIASWYGYARFDFHLPPPVPKTLRGPHAFIVGHERPTPRAVQMVGWMVSSLNPSCDLNLAPRVTKIRTTSQVQLIPRNVRSGSFTSLRGRKKSIFVRSYSKSDQK